MLSRFSKLPGISSLLVPASKYPQELIDKAVRDIRKLGQNVTQNNINNNSNLVLQSITKILTLMRKFSESLEVQKVACHAISNLAMEVVVARWIVQKGGFKLIRRALMTFESDHKLCWLASSAIWNLARPAQNRAKIGKEGVQLMLNVLSNHHLKNRVANTCIGALSNLSLHGELKNVIADVDNIHLIVKVLSHYTRKFSLSVMTSGAGLLANLAVSDEHASTLADTGCLPLLLDLLNTETCVYSTPAQMDTLYRNTCAALNNMVTADTFLDAFLSSKGVESLFKFLRTNQNTFFAHLIENCLNNVEVDAFYKTTSLHLTCLHGRLEILKQLLQEQTSHWNLDAVDDKNMSMLEYAKSMSHLDVVKFLTKCGAADKPQTTTDPSIQDAIDQGKKILNSVRQINQNAIYQTVPELPQDICKLLVRCCSDIEMLQSAGEF